ncbi:MAG TPA: ATP-binding protein [bacterium]|nr:ATP-binding protein [bacterium]
MTPLEQHLRKWMEKAAVDFNMISPGDRVLMAVSGGRDSLAMSRLLRGPFVRMTKDFHVEYAHIDIGTPGHDSEPIREWFSRSGLDIHIVKTDIFAESTGQKKRPCFLCSRKRRKALLETAQSLGCRKIILAHHRDDAVESFLLNLFYNREVAAMLPVQELFKGEYHFIRPLYYIRDHTVKKFADEQNIASLEAGCPHEDDSKREFVRSMLKQLETQRPTASDDLFAAQFRVKPDYLPKAPGDVIPDTPPRI